MMARFSILIILIMSLLTSGCAKDTRYITESRLRLARSSFGYVIGFKGKLQEGTGSGVVVKNYRYYSLVLTAGHICSDPERTFKIQDYTGNEYDAKVLKIRFEHLGKRRDLCLLKTDKRVPHTPIELSARDLSWGDKVWNINASIGDFSPKTKENPHGMIQIDEGLFSGYDPGMSRYVFKGIDVLPGASGSMVVDKHGRLVSLITSFRIKYGHKLNEISYGMPLKDIREFLNEYLFFY